MNENVKLAEIEEELTAAWKELAERGGSFADAIAESCEDFGEAMEQMYPVEAEAHAARVHWISTGVFPALSPGACRLMYMWFYTASFFLIHLRQLERIDIPSEWDRVRLLRWVLCEIIADTTQVALDGMRTDLLTGGV